MLGVLLGQNILSWPCQSNRKLKSITLCRQQCLNSRFGKHEHGVRFAKAAGTVNGFQCIIPATPPARTPMAGDSASTMWVPVCCGRVMRCNMLRLPDGGPYAVLVCTQCNKNITLEGEPLTAADSFGEGSKLLSLLGSPKPPVTERRSKSFPRGGPDDPTL